MATKKTGSTQAKSRKKQDRPQEIQALQQEVKEAVKNLAEELKPFELCWVWHDGDNIEDVAKYLTGYSYNVFKLLDYNHIQAQDIKPGVVLKWGIR